MATKTSKTSSKPKPSGPPPSEQNGPEASSPPAPPVQLASVDEGKDPASIEQPPPAEMVTRYSGDEYRAMSAADERQIAQDLQGRAPKAMLYAFDQGGQQVIGRVDGADKPAFECFFRIKNAAGHAPFQRLGPAHQIR